MNRTKLIFIMGMLLIISCYKGHGLSPSAEERDTSGIRGTVTFNGTWPDSTKEVRVAVLKKYPQGITDTDSLLAFVVTNLVAYGDTIPIHTQQYEYELPLEPDIYAWILVIWFPDIPLYFFGVKELGAYYKNPLDVELPTPVSVVPGMVTEGIDIIADFANLDREAPFFKRR